MRIVHIITRLIIGGAQENTLLTVAGLHHRHGDDVTLITGPAEGPEGDLFERARRLELKVELMPELIRPIAWLSPLWHGVDLCRSLMLGTIDRDPLLAVLHVVVLGTITVLGDFKSEQSIYSIRPPHGGQFASTSTVEGKGETGVEFLPDGVAWPDRFGPKSGFLQSGSEVLEAPSGQVTIKWTVKRGG